MVAFYRDQLHIIETPPSTRSIQVGSIVVLLSPPLPFPTLHEFTLFDRARRRSSPPRSRVANDETQSQAIGDTLKIRAAGGGRTFVSHSPRRTGASSRGLGSIAEIVVYILPRLVSCHLRAAAHDVSTLLIVTYADG